MLYYQQKIQQLSRALIMTLILIPGLSLAATQQHSFTLTGNNGETGSGTFTWDDVANPDGTVLTISALQSASFTISGGNVASSPTTFTLADCTNFIGMLTPVFTSDLNWTCDNGDNAVEPDFANNASLNTNSSTITFSPGTTSTVGSAQATSLPVNAPWALLLLTALVAAAGAITIRQRQTTMLG